MIKYLAILTLIGIVEIIAISTLHQSIGLMRSILIYVLGTIAGGILLYLGKNEAISKFKLMNEIDDSWVKRMRNEPQIFTKNDAKNMRIMYEPMLFILAVVLICVPGVVTDCLGILLAFPNMRQLIIEAIIIINIRKSNA